jgi:protein TonB
VKNRNRDKQSSVNNDKHSFRIKDFDDLVFENRNREYGAYKLRKRYNRALLTGVIIGSLLMTAVVLIPFLKRPPVDRILSGGAGFRSVQMENYMPPEEEIYVPPAPPPPPQQEKIQESVKYVPPVVVDTVPALEQAPATIDEVLAGTDVEDLTITGTGGSGGGDLNGYGSSDTGEPFFIVEVMPLFRGGDLNKFREWVQKRTNYPEEAIQKKIKGRVFLTFIVEPDGSVTNVTVVKGVAPIIDNEAVKAIQASPKWSPGLQRGQPVRVRFSMWLNFVF